MAWLVKWIITKTLYSSFQNEFDKRIIFWHISYISFEIILSIHSAILNRENKGSRFMTLQGLIIYMQTAGSLLITYFAILILVP